jgi:hypothetical protein
MESGQPIQPRRRLQHQPGRKGMRLGRARNDRGAHPRCHHVIDELTMYSYEVDPHTGEVLPKPADKKNHIIDAR